MTRTRELAGRLALLAGSLLLVLLAGELALRLGGYRSRRYPATARIGSRDGRTLLDCYPSNPRGYFPIDLRAAASAARYRHLAVHRYDAVARRDPWAVECRYNSLHFRGPEIGPKPPGTLRVAVLGDSFTEGEGVREEDAYPRVLERLLNRGRLRYEVDNCGRRGADFPQLAELFDQVMALDPDVVVYAMVLNDPERSRAFEARQSYVDDWILDRGRPGAGLEEPPLWSSRLAAFVRDRVDRVRIGRATTRWYREMYGEPNRQGWARTRERIEAMNRRCRSRGVEFLLVSWPLLVDLDHYPFAGVSRTIEAFCLSAGIRRLDLLPALRGRPTRSLWVHPVDMHPNEVAHRLAAEALAPVIRRLEERSGP